MFKDLLDASCVPITMSHCAQFSFLLRKFVVILYDLVASSGVAYLVFRDLQVTLDICRWKFRIGMCERTCPLPSLLLLVEISVGVAIVTASAAGWCCLADGYLHPCHSKI
jgi:hypothetical protein